MRYEARGVRYEAWGVSRVQAAGVGRALATRRSSVVARGVHMPRQAT